MATQKKRASKGNIFDCIDDAQKNRKLREEIQAFIKAKGKGYTPETFLQKFHAYGYDNVSLKDAGTLLANIQKLKNPDEWDWHY